MGVSHEAWSSSRRWGLPRMSSSSSSMSRRVCPHPHPHHGGCHVRSAHFVILIVLVLVEGLLCRPRHRCHGGGCHARPCRRRRGTQVIVLIVLIVAEELSHGDSSSLCHRACPGRRPYLHLRRGGAQGPGRRHVRALWNLARR